MKKKYSTPTIEAEYIFSENTFAVCSTARRSKAYRFPPLSNHIHRFSIRDLGSTLLSSLRLDLSKYKKF